MVKNTQTIRRLLATNCLSVFDYFVGLVRKGVRVEFLFYLPTNWNLHIQLTQYIAYHLRS